MGACPVVLGIDIVRRPTGTLSPKSTSQMASAASEPPNHTFMMAGTCFVSHDSTVGRPAKLSSTTGLPSFTSSSSSACCASGISSDVRVAHSPLISAVSPIAHTITSACCAMFRASAFSAASSPRAMVLPSSPFFCSCSSYHTLQPCAYSSFALPSSALAMLSRRVA